MGQTQEIWSLEMPGRSPRAAVVLNDMVLKNLPAPPSGKVQYADGKVSGFGVRVYYTGQKVFYLSYRFNGQPRRLMLGAYPDKKLAAARGDAINAISLLNKGIDPQSSDAAQDSDLPKQPAQGPTFDTALTQFVSLYCAAHNKASTAAETKRLLNAVFMPVWKGRALSTLSKGDVLTILDERMERGTPSAAIHAYAAIRKFFNWCLERDLLTASPCINLKPPAKKKSRNRVLTDKELGTVWRSSRSEGYPFGTIVQLLSLTAQRRGEVAGMRWSEIDDKRAIWTIPPERTKNGKQHSVPLTPRARALLKLVPRFEGDQVFPKRGKPEEAYAGYSKGKRSLNADVGITDWTLHDLRRTAATRMAELGVAPHIVEKILNHTTGTFGGVAGVYNRFEYQKEMRAALSLWAAHLKIILRPNRKPRLQPL